MIIMRLARLLAPFGAALILTTGFMVAGAPPAVAATITVNTTDDELNSDGNCSLREAIQAANTDTAVDACSAGSGADTINVPVGTYNLTLGQLVIQDSVTISGAGAAATVIDAGGASRVVNVSTGGAPGTVAFSGITLQNGTGTGGAGISSISDNITLNVSDSIVTNNSGSAIYNGGTLNLTNSTVSDNTTTGFNDGAGILNACCSSTATLTDSTVTGNDAPSGRGGGIYNQASLTLVDTDVTGNTAASGGGIWNPAGGTTVSITGGSVSGNTSVGTAGGIFNQNGVLTVDGATISDNETSGNGGGIQNEGAGSATITNSTISGNSAGSGGGIFGHGTVKVANTTVSGNSIGGIDVRGTLTVKGSTISGNVNGEAIHSEGSLTVTNSTISNNAAGGVGVYASASTITTTTIIGVTITGNTAGSGISNVTEFGAGAIANMTVTNSNISDNTAESGGGINNFADGGTLTVNGSTISGNMATNGTGGGINNIGTAAVTNSTISGNSAGCCGGGIQNYGDPFNGNLTINYSTISGNSIPVGPGGGIQNGGIVKMGGTILANNSNAECNGTINSTGYNLIEDTAGCTIAGTQAGNITGMDPKLGPLANNGGPTLTQALTVGSPAFEAGKPVCPPPSRDQRGVTRPQFARCDIGAFESEDLLGIVEVIVENPATLLGSGDVKVDGSIFCGPGGDTYKLLVRVNQTSTGAVSKTGTVAGTCSGNPGDAWTVTPPTKPSSPAFTTGTVRVCFDARTYTSGPTQTDRLVGCQTVNLVT
jgi:CSLREA domain-containing protein